MSRIIIVEDNPAILCGLKDNLEFESHQVLTAAEENAPDLVILDLMLAEAERIRSLPAGARGGIQRAHPDAFGPLAKKMRLLLHTMRQLDNVVP